MHQADEKRTAPDAVMGMRVARRDRSMHVQMRMRLADAVAMALGVIVYVRVRVDGDVAADDAAQEISAEDHQHEPDAELEHAAALEPTSLNVGEMLMRRTITTTAATNSDAVCPMPQITPTQADFQIDRSRPTMVDTATR
jgi:hypothetical protein